jgi:DAK2 domain fusion protein YloV
MKTIKKINGSDLTGILTLAKELIYEHKDQINQLNVFPVPDGDTGTNMYLTLESALKNIDIKKEKSIHNVSKIIAKNAVLGGRGNSGVILSQILQGLSNGLNNIEQCDVNEFGISLESAVQASYKSVSNPVEGTMLTIIKTFSDSWNKIKTTSDSFSTIIPQVCDNAQKVLLDTPNMLNILKEAGVVDAGGQGLIVIFEAMKSYICEENVDIDKIMNKPSSTDNNLSSYFEKHTEDEWGYCVQFVINGDKVSHDDVKHTVDKTGGSTVITGIENYVKVHTHSEDPGSILSSCMKFGDLMEINIENMDKQFEEFAKTSVKQEPLKLNETQISSVIAISNGQGFNELFYNMGVDQIIFCENTINPSVEEILEALGKCLTKDVIVVCTDKNAIMACELASKQSEKNVFILKTQSVSEGLSSMIVCNKENDGNTNLGNMTDSIKNMRFGSISQTSRSGSMNKIEYKENDYISIIDENIVFSEIDLVRSINKTIQHLNPNDDSYLTIYWGSDIKHKDIIEQQIIEINEYLDLEFHDGGQKNLIASLVME